MFLQEFYRLLALTTKALRGWPGEVFDKRSTGQHALLTPEATIEALAYLISNPVASGAVRYVKDWPGALTVPRDIGVHVVKVKRPKHYFNADSTAWPNVVELPTEMPTDLELDYGMELAQQRIALRAFNAQYDKALAAWTADKRTVRFFIGTWWMRVCHGARCGPAP